MFFCFLKADSRGCRRGGVASLRGILVFAGIIVPVPLGFQDRPIGGLNFIIVFYPFGTGKVYVVIDEAVIPIQMGPKIKHILFAEPCVSQSNRCGLGFSNVSALNGVRLRGGVRRGGCLGGVPGRLGGHAVLRSLSVLFLYNALRESTL